MAALIVMIVACAALGFVVARLWVVAVAAVAIIAFYVGLENDWWGNGAGDGWQFAMLLAVIVATAITATAVVAGRTRRN